MHPPSIVNVPRPKAERSLGAGVDRGLSSYLKGLNECFQRNDTVRDLNQVYDKVRKLCEMYDTGKKHGIADPYHSTELAGMSSGSAPAVHKGSSLLRLRGVFSRFALRR